MMRKMWFGTREYSRWIKVHSPGSEPSMSGSSDRIDFANGGVGLRQSANAHHEYALTWNRLSAKEVREITDFAYGVYGDGHLYLSDPGVMDKNVLNRAWSIPALSASDGIPLAGKKRPEIIKNNFWSRAYPINMAKYQLTAADPRRSFYVPVPPGYTAWVGAHGDTASTLRMSVVRTVNGMIASTPTAIPVTSNDSATRVSHSFAASQAHSGIELSIGAGAGFITLSGIIVQVLPTGVTPQPGDFISGQGSSGLEIEGKPQVSPYSYFHDSYGVSMRLVETEDWA